jgi:hypothetical protein
MKKTVAYTFTEKDPIGAGPTRTRVFAVLQKGQAAWQAVEVWWDYDTARCSQCSGVVVGMSSACKHALALRRHMVRTGELSVRPQKNPQKTIAATIFEGDADKDAIWDGTPPVHRSTPRSPIMSDNRDEHIDRLTFYAMTGIVHGEKLRNIISRAFHEGMHWRFDQPDIQEALKAHRQMGPNPHEQLK